MGRQDWNKRIIIADVYNYVERTMYRIYQRNVTTVAEDIWVHILRVGVVYLTYTT